MGEATALLAPRALNGQRGDEALENWFTRGACIDRDPDELFVEGQSAQRDARSLCLSCPVRVECLADALNNKVEFGVWGGMTERERRMLLRRSPEVRDWLPILRDIQDEQDSQRAEARQNLTDLWNAMVERKTVTS